MKFSDVKINLKELKEFKKKNMQERLKFIDYWADYVRNNPDKEWSRQQNIVINSQINQNKAIN